MPFTETAQQTLEAASPSSSLALNLTGSPNVLYINVGVGSEGLQQPAGNPAQHGTVDALNSVFYAVGGTGVSAAPGASPVIGPKDYPVVVPLTAAITHLAAFANNGNSLNVMLGILS